MWVSEDYLVKDSYGPESFRQEVAFTNNLITSLRPYIQGHVSFKDRSPSPKKVHARPAKKKKSKLSESESESSSSTDEEETRTTPGAELASGVL